MRSAVTDTAAGRARRLPALMLAVALVLAAALGGCIPGDDTAAPSAPPGAVLQPNAVVERVIDGDTIVVRVGGAKHTARLIGIDTPETVDSRRPIGCFGPEASDHTKSLLPKGTAVQLQMDAEARDTYGRLLVYVLRAQDGLFVNLDLVRLGYADTMSIKPNTAHAATFSHALAQARAERAGMWGQCPAGPHGR